MDQHRAPHLIRAILGAKPDSRLFRAEFQYLPLRDSPNDNPHVELALHPGELLLVHGPMDEDKFYWGETLDGRAGLVPSNFVQRVPEKELAELLQSTTTLGGTPPWPLCRPLAHPCPAVPSTSAAAAPCSAPFFPSPPTDDQLTTTNRPTSPSFPLAVPNHLAQISHDFTESDQVAHAITTTQKTPLPDSVCPYPPVDVSRVTVQEVRHPDQPRLPWPRELQVERRLSRSLLLSWMPPESGAGGTIHQPISQYQLCVNGQVRAVVPGSFKCRALLEDLDLDKMVNISVRAVGADGLASADPACTLAVGAEAPVAPQHVRVGQITPNSVQLSWLPSNSNAECLPLSSLPSHLCLFPSSLPHRHVVLLNALKVGVCPSAVFQVQLNGLSPSTIYRLSVRTKHPRAVLEKRPVERCVDFKTLPKIGLPDPPSDVQAESGPQPGTLLVSWRPNSSQPKPPSRAAVHGYLLYADGRCIAQVPGSTADHVLLRLADFADDPPVFLTVRTRTREGTMSADSNVVRVPRSATTGGGTSFLMRGDDMLLSCSLPSHLLGRLVATTNGPSPASLLHPSTAINKSPQQQQQGGDGGLLLIPAEAAQPAVQNGPRWDESTTAAAAGAMVAFRQLPSSYPQAAAHAQQQQQQQYFTFHPKALDKEFPRIDERPDVLAMEQNYLLRHQQRQQRLGGATISQSPDRRSFPLATVAKPRGPPGGGLANPQHPPMSGRPPIPLQLVRLRNDMPAPGSTRSEPDLRPSRVPGMDESRWFVAIGDHQPALAAPEELPFRRHQLVKVYGDVDGNGCFWAEVRGRYGLVPAGKMVEIAKDDLFLAAEQRKPTASTGSLRRMRWGSIKSRSYEYAAENGQQRRQRAAAFLGGGSDHEGAFGGHLHQQSWQNMAADSLAEKQRGGGWSGGGRTEMTRRMSAVEGGGGGGTGYRLPAVVNGGPRSSGGWRGEEGGMERMGADMVERQHRGGLGPRGPPEDELVDNDGLVPGEVPGGGEWPTEGELPAQSSLRGAPSQSMVAKYDYDSRQLSPNVDAEQVELSFRQGDMITVYGPMDEDGFYLGELNGVRGLVPSNFLQPAAQQPSEVAQARPKGVAFSSDLALGNNNIGAAGHWPPNSAITNKLAGGGGGRRATQQAEMGAAGRQGPSATARLTGSTGMTSKAYKVPGIAQAAPGKALTKKSSDLSAKTLQQQPAGRKGSQATAGKGPTGALKRKG